MQAFYCNALADSPPRQVTSEGLDPHHTPVSEIMTRNPMVTRDTTSATEALELMVSRHFRHLVSYAFGTRQHCPHQRRSARLQ